MKNQVNLLMLLLLLLQACGDRKTGQVDLIDASEQMAYSPLFLGKFVEFRIDSVVFDPLPNGTVRKDSIRTYLREVVTDTFRDNEGRLSYSIERFERQSDAEPWVIKNVWSATRTGKEFLRTEDNLRFLRLIFPMDARTEWDGNRYLDEYQTITLAGDQITPFSNWVYQVDSIDMPGTVGAFTFDSMLIVTEVDNIDDNNVFERRLSRSAYAKNVGLVRREQWLLDSQYCNDPTPADCQTKPWDQKAEKGFILRQWLLRHN